MFDQIHELFARLGLLEESRKVGSGGQGVLFLDAAHLHTHMLGFDDNHDAKRIERFLDAFFNLHRQAFLDLEAAGEDIHDTGNLAQSCDIFFGDIGDKGSM